MLALAIVGSRHAPMGTDLMGIPYGYGLGDDSQHLMRGYEQQLGNDYQSRLLAQQYLFFNMRSVSGSVVTDILDNLHRESVGDDTAFARRLRLVLIPDARRKLERQ